MRILITSILFCFLLSACDKGEEEAMAPEKSMDKAGGMADTGGMADESGAMASANGKTVDGTFYPDHEKDAKEFEIRSSLAGVKRMIESYKKEGYDTAELEKRKAELEKKLSKVTG